VEQCWRPFQFDVTEPEMIWNQVGCSISLPSMVYSDRYCQRGFQTEMGGVMKIDLGSTCGKELIVREKVTGRSSETSFYWTLTPFLSPYIII
jgi:hypothetical protein